MGSNITKVLYELEKKAMLEDILFINFSGHGKDEDFGGRKQLQEA